MSLDTLNSQIGRIKSSMGSLERAKFLVKEDQSTISDLLLCLYLGTGECITLLLLLKIKPLVDLAGLLPLLLSLKELMPSKLDSS